MEKIKTIIGSLEPWDDDNADKAIKSILTLLTSEVEKETERCIQMCHKIAVMGTFSFTKNELEIIDACIAEIKSGRKALSDIKEEGK